MVQRKKPQSSTFQTLITCFGQDHVKTLGPEMMMMKRTKSKKRLKDSVSDSPAKVTGGSPNYMKDTTCSEAKKGKTRTGTVQAVSDKKRFSLVKHQKIKSGPNHDSCSDVDNRLNSSSRIARALTKAPSFKRCSQRATCSSTLKDSKFPEYLILNHGGTEDKGTSVLKVCPYTYCSLNGHLHRQYPPLKSFISARRRSLKSQKSVKMEVFSPRKKELVEIYVDEMKKDESYEVDVETHVSESVSEGAPRSEIDSDDCSERTDVGSESEDMMSFPEADGLEETLVGEAAKEIQEKANRDEDSESGCFDSEIMGMMEKSAAENASKEEDDAGKETLEDDHLLKPEDCKDVSQERIDLEETGKVSFTRKQKPCNQEQPDVNISWTINSKKPEAETEDSREFNPREPNYLPIVLPADSEKVDLKHQDIDERKNSEDWMFDYALQRAVSKLAPARKRKVALLVEAFETVSPIPHGRESGPALTYGRHLQACN